MYIKILLVILFNISLYSGQAIPGLKTFTQPDGTQFIGELKGDSSFHWIQSNGDIIIYNPKDKCYYKAIVDKDKGLIPTAIKPAIISTTQKSPSLKLIKQKNISKEDITNLRYLNKKAKSISHPR